MFLTVSAGFWAPDEHSGCAYGGGLDGAPLSSEAVFTCTSPARRDIVSFVSSQSLEGGFLDDVLVVQL